jgi:long-subunit acyl-CoA synthetase (AMP-forming)
MDLISWTFESDIDDKDKPVSCYSAYPSESKLTEQLLLDACDISRSLSYNQILSHVRRLVAGLQAVGIEQGDCVCVNSFNDVSSCSLI